MLAVFEFLHAILNAIPALRAWYVEFNVYITNKEKSALRAELFAAKDKMFTADGNQIDLEKALGSANAGKPAQDQSGVREKPNT